MHVDTKAEFSDAQAVTATAISSNVMRLKDPLALAPNALRQIGAPGVAYLMVSVGAAAAATGAATVTVTLESAEDAGLSTNPVVHATTGAIPKTSLTAGAIIAKIPLPNDGYKEYLGVRYTVATGPLTAGSFNAYLSLDMQSWKPFADAVAD